MSDDATDAQKTFALLTIERVIAVGATAALLGGAASVINLRDAVTQMGGEMAVMQAKQDAMVKSFDVLRDAMNARYSANDVNLRQLIDAQTDRLADHENRIRNLESTFRRNGNP